MPTVTTQTFSSKDVAELVGITYRQLDYWCRTDTVVASIVDAAGSGSRRGFSYEDVQIIAALARLRQLGLTCPQMGQAGAWLAEEANAFEGLVFATPDGLVHRSLPVFAHGAVILDLTVIDQQLRHRLAIRSAT